MIRCKVTKCYNVTTEREEKKREDSESDLEREGDSAAAAPPALARDSRNMIFLDDGQYSALVTDLGEHEVQRCISYLSEFCAMHGKPYKDWDAAIRKCSREKWGEPSPTKPGSGDGTDFQPTADRIRKNNDWLDAFLAEQQEKPKWNLKTTKL